jgi:hypothetical protein
VADVNHKYSTKGETPKHVADAAEKATLRGEMAAAKVEIEKLKKPK